VFGIPEASDSTLRDLKFTTGSTFKMLPGFHPQILQYSISLEHFDTAIKFRVDPPPDTTVMVE
jgi:hypothetical protein